MAFGSFVAEARPEKTRRERPAREKTVRERPERVKVEPVVDETLRETPPSKGRDKLRIVLLGRSLSIMQEFLCGMNLNMSEALSGLGLAYYTRESATINDLVGKKKRLEQFCWSFSSDDWSYPEHEDAERR